MNGEKGLRGTGNYSLAGVSCQFSGQAVALLRRDSLQLVAGFGRLQGAGRRFVGSNLSGRWGEPKLAHFSNPARALAASNARDGEGRRRLATAPRFGSSGKEICSWHVGLLDGAQSL